MRIAVVEDDNDLAIFLRDTMRELGHNCDHFPNGAKLISALRRSTYDLLLLDWHLPDTTGFELLQKIRAGNDTDTSIIMLTSLSDKDAIAKALRAGADDYIVKPESAAVIAARVEAVSRRSRPGRSSDRLLSFDNYEFDRLTETVRIGADLIAVNSKEFSLALLLFENIHRPLSRSYILETVWNADPNLSTRTLDMHISRIRSTLRLRPENGFRIASVSGYGYRLERFAQGDVH
jgi:DNA-binding response OmpR family regulator